MSSCPSPFDTPVLVVDAAPESAILPLLADVRGVQLLQARSPAQALERAAGQDLAAVLLRLDDGSEAIELARALRATQRAREVPIVFMAPGGMPLPLFEGDDAAPVDVIALPPDARLLRAKLALLVDFERRRRDIAECRAEVQRLLEAGRRMTVAMTHDLRSPLSVISMNAELVRLRGRDELLQQAAARIKSSSTRMGRMIDQLLEFSGRRSGPLRRRAVDLRELASTLLDELSQGTPQAPIELQADGDANAVVDVERMRQVLSNLVNNALQHGEPGSPVVVRVDGSHPAHVELEVRNAGGLPPEVQAEPFRPFRSLSSNPATGLGLGLYIVQRLVQAHGGRVVVDGASGHTRVQVTVPREAAGGPH